MKDFFSKCDPIRKKLLLRKSLIENFVLCTLFIFGNCNFSKKQTLSQVFFPGLLQICQNTDFTEKAFVAASDIG